MAQRQVEASRSCIDKEITIEGIQYRIYVNGAGYTNQVARTVHNACVYDADGYRYASYLRFFCITSYCMGGAVGEYGVAVARDGDTSYRYAEGFGDKYADEQLYLGNTTAFLQHAPGSSDNGVRFYRNVVDHLVEQINGTFALDDYPDFRYVDDGDDQMSAYGLGMSSNGRWISFGVRNFGIIVLNLDTLEAVRVSDRYIVQSSTWPVPQLTTDVSDNGSYVVVGGMAYPTEVITVESCGSVVRAQSGLSMPQQLSESCPYINLNELTHNVSESVSGGYRAFERLQVNASGSMFSYWDRYKWHTIYAPNYLQPGQLYYLALGDSYASGEGDITIDGTDHYLSGTNIHGDYAQGLPRETCHASKRAYTMRLAAAMQLMHGADMRTVACSGAVISDILTSSRQQTGYVDPQYLGQVTQHVDTSEPRLKGIFNASTLQQEARETYVPGRVQQIELVKKAQPLYMTVMAGGNDIDFAGVMMACAKNSLPAKNETCEYAVGDGLAGQAKKVYDLYPKLLDFYKALHEASPRTKIYAIGYPQFMDEQNESCTEMMSLYSQQERKAIHDLIAYANGVIRNAANDAGASYIDISDALSGKELCAGGTGMAGMTDILVTAIYTEYMKSITMSDSILAKYLNVLPTGSAHEFGLKIYVAERAAALAAEYAYSPATTLADISQELAHPNAIGHQAIYESIASALGDDLLESARCGVKISCPSGTIAGRPSIDSYLPGLSVKSGTVYISGNGKVTISHQNGSGKTTVGALVKGVAVHLIRVMAGIIAGEVDTSRPVTVELHSEPVMLGAMTKVGDTYELQARLPDTVNVGRHVLHVMGSLMDGSSFDIDAPVFVEGPSGDMDDDGVSNAVDTCAFNDVSGADTDKDGIDDACDIVVADISRDQKSDSGLIDRAMKVKDDRPGILIADVAASGGSTSHAMSISSKAALTQKQSDDTEKGDLREGPVTTGYDWTVMIFVGAVIVLCATALHFIHGRGEYKDFNKN